VAGVAAPWVTAAFTPSARPQKGCEGDGEKHVKEDVKNCAKKFRGLALVVFLKPRCGYVLVKVAGAG
jgi:hypothetical protein